MALPNIAFSGRIGSGKTTAADVLIRTHGYIPVSFAAPLKQMVIEADPLVEYETHMEYGNPVTVPIHLADIMASGRTFEWCKREYPEVRRSLQRIGQGVRKVDPNYWVIRALYEINSLANYRVVVADMRYPNEADALRRNGFTLVRIDRPTLPAGMTMAEPRAALHDSETSLDDYEHFDHRLSNDGTANELHEKVLDLLK